MPFYDYDCEACGPFIHHHTIDDRDTPTRCPDCGERARRLVTAPSLSTMSPLRRDAAMRNEKSQHEPRISRGHLCGNACGCGKKAAVTLDGKPRLQRPKKNKRPWMLGH